AQELGRVRMTGRTGLALGRALRLAGRTGEARTHIEAALTAARARNSDIGTAGVLDALAQVAEDEGDAQEAEEHRSAAAELRGRHGLA
nr:regulator [Streptomyces sp. DSM 41633]